MICKIDINIICIFWLITIISMLIELFHINLFNYINQNFYLLYG